MSPEKTNTLISKYPNIFGKEFWFECDDGWFNIVDTLCENIENYRKTNKNISKIKAVQVKEKFGGLRFYINGGNDHIYELIENAEKQSITICETCAAPAKIHSLRNWLMCRCNECFKKEEDRFNK